jgi:hypothetical protein
MNKVRGVNSSHIWKITWYWSEAEKRLKIATNSKSLGNDLSEEDSEKIRDNFLVYKGYNYLLCIETKKFNFYSIILIHFLYSF